MRRRCLSPSSPIFRYYGGRGIKICAGWGDYLTFLADMGERPAGRTLDRIDNDGDYEPGNCRWATRVEQANNKSSNRILSALGQRKTMAQWAAETGIKTATIWARLELYDWTPAEALGFVRRERVPAWNKGKRYSQKGSSYATEIQNGL